MNKSLSPQSISAYRLLAAGREMTAREMATALGILPQAIYRAVRPLEEIGLVGRVGKYPLRYQSKSISTALETYLLFQQEWFSREFGSGAIKRITDKENENRKFIISFISKKEVLHKYEVMDLVNIKKHAHFIVSGLELPAEVVLAIKRAVEKGATIKILVQQFNVSNAEMLKNLKKMGIKIRTTKNINSRIFIFDDQVVYLTSYKPQEDREVTGVRLEHLPIAQLLNRLFSEKWKEGKPL